MELIELHILQSFPVTCLNRDDLGAPKSAQFGGVQRARVSSQSWKRAIRAMAQELQPGRFAAKRSRFVIRTLQELFHSKGVGSEDAARELAVAVADALGAVDSVEKGNVKTLLFFSPCELENVVQEMLDLDYQDALKKILAAGDDKKKLKNARDKLTKLAKKPSKALGKAVKDAADIAVFGRMVADDHSLTVEGAGLFSHALSTHRATSEIDFFSAVDDAGSGGDDAGAAHIGTLEFNSACYYRYVGLNLDLLRDEEHLALLDEAELDTVLEAFLRSAVLAVPGARKNSMFGFSPPAFVLGLRRRGQPLSLINAFERPVRKQRNEGFIIPSVKALEQHLGELRTAYDLKADVEVCLPAETLDTLVARLSGKAQS